MNMLQKIIGTFLLSVFLIACSDEEASIEPSDEPAVLNVTLSLSEAEAGLRIHCLVLKSDKQVLSLLDRYKFYTQPVSEITEEYSDVMVGADGIAIVSTTIYPMNLTGIQTSLEIIVSDSGGIVKRYKKFNPLSEYKAGEIYNVTLTADDWVSMDRKAKISNKYTIEDAGIYEVVDPRDGKAYKTVKFYANEQWYVWLAENLDVGVLCDWDYNESSMTTYIKQYYEANLDYGTVYGGLYKLEAALQVGIVRGDDPNLSTPVRGISPEGWHIPSNEEWSLVSKNEKLMDALNLKLGGYNAALWGGFMGLGTEGGWWSSTMHKDSEWVGLYWYGWLLKEQNGERVFDNRAYHCDYAFSVRCVLNN